MGLVVSREEGGGEEMSLMLSDCTHLHGHEIQPLFSRPL